MKVAMSFLDVDPALEKRILEAIDSGKDEKQVPSDTEVLPFVRQLGELVGTDDIGPSSSEEYKCDTCIRGELLQTWGEKARDRDAHVANTEVVPLCVNSVNWSEWRTECYPR